MVRVPVLLMKPHLRRSPGSGIFCRADGRTDDEEGERIAPTYKFFSLTSQFMEMKDEHLLRSP